MAKNQYEDISEQQMKFADYYFEFNHATNAAIKAGYSERTASSQASQLLKNPKVKAYLVELQDERRERIQNALKKQAEKAVNMLLELAENAESESVKLQAIKDIMDRAGHKAVEKVENKNETNGKIEFSFVDPNAD